MNHRLRKLDAAIKIVQTRLTRLLEILDRTHPYRWGLAFGDPVGSVLRLQERLEKLIKLRSSVEDMIAGKLDHKTRKQVRADYDALRLSFGSAWPE